MYVGGRLEPMYEGDAQLRKACDRIVRDGVAAAAGITRALTPRGLPRTPPNVPTLRDSIYQTPVKHHPPADTEASWATDKEYAPYVEHGFGLGHEPDPHSKYPIVPKKPGGTLHFFTKDGHEVFTKMVMHPGNIHTPARHMFARAAAVLEAQLDSFARPALDVWRTEMEQQGEHQTPVVIRGKP